MSDLRNEWITARAYAIWEEAGRPFGRDQDHWAQATRERDLMERTRASSHGNDILAFHPSVQETRDIAAALNHASVLVVDDDAQVRLDTLHALEDLGVKTFEAENADQALSVLNSNEVTTVYSDISMPGSMDGMGLASRVRSLWPRTHVILASGLLRISRRDLDPGIQFVPKPVPFYRLLGLIWANHAAEQMAR